MTKMFEQQLEGIISEYNANRPRWDNELALVKVNHTEISDLRTRCMAAIERASGSSSTYSVSVVESRKRKANALYSLSVEVGVASALLSDIRNGYLTSFEELLHGDVFGDYLEMASHLLKSGYKDAAAVLAGGTLEVHLRKLCNKHSISTMRAGKPRKSEDLNSDLAKKTAYTKLDQKNVTAWLGLRNHAAHGHYSEYTKDQVALFVQGVQDFITRHSA